MVVKSDFYKQFSLIRSNFVGTILWWQFRECLVSTLEKVLLPHEQKTYAIISTRWKLQRFWISAGSEPPVDLGQHLQILSKVVFTKLTKSKMMKKHKEECTAKNGGKRSNFSGFSFKQHWFAFNFFQFWGVQ